MGSEYGKESYRPGIPYHPEGEERALFLRGLRKQIVNDLGGMQDIVRFNGRQRFKVRVPEGDALFECIRDAEDLGGSYSTYKDLRVRVTIPCGIPETPWLGDSAFRNTYRFPLYVDKKSPDQQPTPPVRDGGAVVTMTLLTILTISTLIAQHVDIRTAVERTRQKLQHVYDYIDGVDRNPQPAWEQQQPQAPITDPRSAMRR